MHRLLLIIALLLSWTVALAPHHARSDDKAPTFEPDVRPIFKAHCFQCHGEAGERKGGLDVRLVRFLTAGGDSGAAVVPTKADESYLLDRIVSGEMPPGKVKLSKKEVDVIERWIASGARTLRPEPEDLDGPLITEEERNFWAFRPVVRPEVPVVQTTDRIHTPIDAFLLRKLEQNSLTFSAAADRRTLIRRACFDLIGLPPKPEEVDAFVNDASVNAYERMLDGLLASPHYGERWGRHWLDVAGYADSEGYVETDPERKWAFLYRDYVIKSFNENKPFDEFIREQLAGDEMVDAPYKNLRPADAEKLIATGFLRMAKDGTAAGDVDKVVAQNDVVADTIQIISTSLLGLTVGCAQCHDHRYDPIPQTDYYHFRAIFEPAFNTSAWRVPNARLISLYTDADRQQAAEIEKRAKEVEAERTARQSELVEQVFERELAKLPEDEREAARLARNTAEKERTPEQKAIMKKYPSLGVTAGSLRLFDSKAAAELTTFTDRANAIRKEKTQERFVRALTEIPGTIPETHFLYRGDPNQPRETLAPAGLTVLRDEPQEIAVNNETLPTTGRRLAYAQYLTSGKHPLTARVIVNRVWMHHFGRGIVPTAGDFGALGQLPTHPELLDWLADEFVRSGWDMHRLHKLIMMSSAYQQQIRNDAHQDEIDPDNELYGGRQPQRLEAEVVRDAVLAVAGKLNVKPFGEPVPIMADRVGQYVLGKENLNAGRPGPIIPLNGEEFRRSVYVQVRRSRPLATLDTFDMPRMDPNCEQRAVTTVAPQSLLLLNNEFILEQSEYFAQRVQQDMGDDLQAQVGRSWQLALSRSPTAEEESDAVAFLAEQAALFKENETERMAVKPYDKNLYQPGQLKAETQALASLCQILLGSNEFLYVD